MAGGSGLDYDLVVVGGGPGGYPGALAAVLRGLRVAVVEARGLGGECTLYGCVPSKVLLHAAYVVYEARRLGGSASLPLGRVLEEAAAVAGELSRGVGLLLRGRGVDVVWGRGRLVGRGRVEVELAGGGVEVLSSRLVLLAPGSEPWAPRGLEPDGVLVLDNRGFLGLRRRVGRVLIVGGGPVGVEYAQALAALGVETVLVEALPRLLPGVSVELGRYAARLLRRLGVEVRTGCGVEVLERLRGERVRASLSCGGVVEADVAVVATGRRSAAPGAVAEGLRGGLLDGRGFVRVDSRLSTGLPGVYAAGDAVGPPMLAHKAVHESLAAVENMLGGGVERPQARRIPVVVYGLVEMAQVGYTSAVEAAGDGYEAGEVRVRLGGVARAYIEGGGDGFVKIVYDRGSGSLLGLVAAAPGA
ncbi:MAG: NAD(P)/FAD-dependent oxidoreductase, partial [Crenarchaeota archaeon]|nr:NAD(P)/FAD-dependent oxidoreductase [Thermoproteota archaeon]